MTDTEIARAVQAQLSQQDKVMQELAALLKQIDQELQAARRAQEGD
jgi:hypothetical protein